MLRVQVDFNSRDEMGNIPAPLADAIGTPLPGLSIDLFDDEGNRCLGTVVAVEAFWVTVKPEWTTFTRPEESRVVNRHSK